ncbi:transmembrane protein, putative [Medicago truncatula]|uniref:Transmembrane protein, putative n=1 Tax=Medicago truncatula TaxID=3880 RepID=A0A072VED9_MEDTR|nr:transmembrane protein, putative [Medicago truncatula]
MRRESRKENGRNKSLFLENLLNETLLSSKNRSNVGINAPPPPPPPPPLPILILPLPLPLPLHLHLHLHLPLLIYFRLSNVVIYFVALFYFPL